MTGLERVIARIGITGVLVITLTLSILVNLLQLRSAAKSDAKCAETIQGLEASARKIEADREATARRIASQTRREAIEAQNATIATTQERAERVRTIIRTVEIPAGCPVSLPDRVQDALSEAVRAANG